MTATVDVLAQPARLDAHIARMTADDPTLTDISAVLHLLGTADDVDGVRIQALCLLASRALGKFDTWTRSAPADALKEIVAEALQVCAGPLCDESVAPWTGDSYCGPACRNAHLRAVGETS